MTALWAIAWREVRLRSSFLSFALVLGCLPLIAGRYWSFSSIGESGVTLTLSLALAGVAGLFCGWSMLGPELTSGRLAFLFCRPVPWWAIWGGKITASLALPLGVGLLVTVPSLMAGQGNWASLWTGQARASSELLLVESLFTVLLVIGLANAASVAYVSRPGQRAIDLLLFGIWAFALLTPSRALTIGAWSLGVERPEAAMQFPVAAALLVASAAQVRGGRLDPYRSHASLSLAVWMLVFASLAALAGLGRAMDTAGPTHLRRVARAEGAPRGGWIWVAGPVGWGQYSAAFLYEPTSGRHVPLGSARNLRRVAFSPEGDSAAVVQTDVLSPDQGRTRVVYLDGKTPETTLFGQVAEHVALCPGGVCAVVSRLAYRDWPTHRLRGVARGVEDLSPTLQFWALPDGHAGRTLGGNAIPDVPSRLGNFEPNAYGAWIWPVKFRSDGLFGAFLRGRCWWRSWGFPGAADDWRCLSIVRGSAGEMLGLPRGTSGEARPMVASGSLQVGKTADAVLRANATLELLLLRTRDSRYRLDERQWNWGELYAPGRQPGWTLGWRICLHDGVSGDHLRTLTEPARDADADFLSDGRIALAEVRDGRAQLRLLANQGKEEERRIELGPAATVLLAGEPAPGEIFAALRQSPSGPAVAALVDLAAGSVVPLPGVYPASPTPEAELSPTAERPAPGSIGSQLLLSEDGALVRYDPETRTRTVLLGPGRK